VCLICSQLLPGPTCTVRRWIEKWVFHSRLVEKSRASSGTHLIPLDAISGRRERRHAWDCQSLTPQRPARARMRASDKS
jgi:hypothetical protein